MKNPVSGSIPAMNFADGNCQFIIILSGISPRDRKESTIYPSITREPAAIAVGTISLKVESPLRKPVLTVPTNNNAAANVTIEVIILHLVHQWWFRVK